MFALSWSLKSLGITNWAEELRAPPTCLTRRMQKFHDWWMKPTSWRIRSAPNVWFWKNLKFRIRPCVNAVKIRRRVWLHKAPLNQLRKSGLLLLLRPFQRNCNPWWKFWKIFRLNSTRMSALEDAQVVHVDQFQSHNTFRSSSKTSSFSSTCRIRGTRVSIRWWRRWFWWWRWRTSSRSHAPKLYQSQGSSWEGRCGCSFASVCHTRLASFQCFGFQSLEKRVVADHGKVGYLW